MTNFIYNMWDELTNVFMHLPLGDGPTVEKLVDHIEAQGKQLRELNAAITKRNATIEKYEREKKELQERNNYCLKKIGELNNGIRDAEDLTWKQKYDALLHSSDQAINALQKKCQEYKNSESNAIIEKYERENKELIAAIIERDVTIKNLKRDNEELHALLVKKIGELNNGRDELYLEKQVSKDLNIVINNKNKLLDEYMTKYNNLEHNYKEEVRMKEEFKRTIESQKSTIKYLEGRLGNSIRLNNVLKAKLISIRELANKIDDIITSEE